MKTMNNKGFGVVEVVLLIAVVIGLVIIFNGKISVFIESILDELLPQAQQFIPS